MRPLVSAVTPFHNTEKYLATCIESVLAQKYENFEYILVDNCSTDKSGEIAADYAKRDGRIRLIRRSSLLTQVQNYNAALLEISAESKYTKIVQADDAIFPDCLEQMVQAFEQSESIGLVSAYDMKGSQVRGSGFPSAGSGQVPLLRGAFSGREVAQLYLRSGVFVFGSPTTVMYRSSLTREQQPFYDESRLHEDTEKCMQILKDWDFGFAYQVLSFLRMDSKSISGVVRSQQPEALDRYIIVERYAASFLDETEAKQVRRQSKQEYYEVLADACVRFRGRSFWLYHEAGLKTLGQRIDIGYLALSIARLLFWMFVNPGDTVRRLIRYRNRGLDQSQQKLSDEFSHARNLIS
jgi:glycosyltransferase involved in cell wall biosynthesis